MEKGAIFIGWGEIFPGREERALKVFNDGIQLWTRMQKQGDIESFEPVLLGYHGGDLAGFTLVRGDRDKITQLRMNQDFQEQMIKSAIVVSKMGVIDAFIGEDLQRRFLSYQKLLSESR
jgi:hypothetical protein